MSILFYPQLLGLTPRDIASYLSFSSSTKSVVNTYVLAYSAFSMISYACSIYARYSSASYLRNMSGSEMLRCNSPFIYYLSLSLSMVIYSFILGSFSWPKSFCIKSSLAIYDYILLNVSSSDSYYIWVHTGANLFISDQKKSG